MSTRRSKCPKCGGEMVQGFIADHSHGSNLIQRWHEGPPRKYFWGGVKAPAPTGMPVGAFRCKDCGFLELYSDPKFAAK